MISVRKAAATASATRPAQRASRRHIGAGAALVDIGLPAAGFFALADLLCGFAAMAQQ